MPLTGKLKRAIDKITEPNFFITSSFSLNPDYFFDELRGSAIHLFSRLRLCDCGGSRWRGSSSAATDAHQIIAQRLDLQISPATENIIRSARIERRHFGPRLNFLRVFQPLQNPVWIEPLA